MSTGAALDPTKLVPEGAEDRTSTSNTGTGQADSQEKGDAGKENQEPQTRKLKIDGEEREYSEEQIQAAAQKWLAGDDRLKTASQKMKEAKMLEEEVGQTRGLGEALKQADKGDPKAIRSIGNYLGWAEEDIQARIDAFEEYNSQDEGSESDDGSRTVSQRPGRNRPVGFEDLDTNMQELLQRAYKVVMKDSVNENTGIIRNALDADPELSKIGKKKPEARAALEELASELAGRQVLAGRSEFGPRLVQDTIQRVRGLVKKVVPEQPEPTPHPGLGQSADLIEGAAVVTPDKPPERVESSSPDRTQNLLDRLNYMMWEEAKGET